MRIPRTQVRRLVARVLRGERSRRQIHVVFVTDAAMRRLNRRFLKHDYITDVLAFPPDEVVVAPGVAIAEARRRRIPAREELLRYVAHGVLHLLGYDDKKPASRRRMWARQERYLSSSRIRMAGTQKFS